MKKFHAFLLAGVVALATTTAVAQAFPGKPVQKAAPKSMNSLRLLPEKQSLEFPAAQVFKGADVQFKSTTNVANGPRRATPLITTPPEGTVKYYNRSGGAYSARNNGNTPVAQEGLMTIVFCDNNEVYMLNPLSYALTDTYVKGTLNGNTITVQLPQTLYNFSSYNLELAWLDATAYVNGTASSYYNSALMADRSNTTAVYTIGADGTISLQGSSSTYVLAGMYDDDDMWYGAADFESVYTPAVLEEEITPPAGITPVTYNYTGSCYYSSANHEFAQTVNVVKDGNDVYFQGLATGDANYPILPNAWAKGTLSGTKVTIPMGQYMGLYSGSAIYLVGYNGTGASDITFTYDAQADTYTLDNIMFVNGKADAIYYYTYIQAGALITQEAPVVPELVTVPDGVTIEDDWTIEATFNTNNGASPVNKTTSVAFDGNDVYIQGIPFYFGNAWMKGTISGNTATFASGQYVGSDDYGSEYMVGYDGSICDIVFNYDSQAKKFTLVTPYIAENQETNELAMWGYYNAMTIYKGTPEQPEVVEVPEGLETQLYFWTGDGVTFDQATDEQINVAFSKQINIGFDGTDVYVQGLCTDLPEAWVKGTLNGTTATFATGQYFGADERMADWGYTFDHYFLGYGTGIEDVVFNYNPETGVFTTDTWIIDNEYENQLNYYLIFSSNVWTPFVEQAGKPANPEIVGLNLTGTYPSIQLDIPTLDVDGNNMNVNKLYYRLYSDVEHEVALIPFAPDLYPECGFEQTMYEIPYTLDDDWDIYEGGARVYLNQGTDFLATLNQIGVQSVYYGGMDTPAGMQREPADNESDIVWYFIKDYAVRTIAGTVTDEEGQPLAGVIVTAVAVTDEEPAGMRREPAQDLTTVTDSEGNYNIEVPANATYNLTFEKEGYKSQTVSEDDAENVTMVLDVITAVTDLKAGVASVTYINAAGLKSDKPFDGVNIVVRRMSDGTVSTTKMVK